MDKRIASADAAVEKMLDGATILMGGFGLCGIPENLIAAVRRKGTKDLTIVSNNAGGDDFGIGVLLQQGQVKERISTYVDENKLFEQLDFSGEFDGRMFVMERAIRGNFAFIRAWKGDRWGNLIYRKTARNFNPMMATAADYVIAEVEELVELGQLDPNQVHTPGIFIDAIFQGPQYEKRIERRTVRKV